MPRSSTARWAIGGSFLALAACGGPDDEAVRRSQSELDLGVGLLGEGNVAGAFQHIDEAIRLDPDNAEARLVAGNLYLFRSEFGPAETQLRAALAANLRLGRSGRPALAAEAHNSLGVLYIHRHDYPHAVEELRLATGDLMNRTPHLAWGNLGWAYYEQRDLVAATEALAQAVRLQPQFCGAWYRLGQVGFAQGEGGEAAGFERAEAALTHALEVTADECQALQDAWLLRGETRARLARREDAIADFERCVELGPETETGRSCARLLEGAH